MLHKFLELRDSLLLWKILVFWCVVFHDHFRFDVDVFTKTVPFWKQTILFKCACYLSRGPTQTLNNQWDFNPQCREIPSKSKQGIPVKFNYRRSGNISSIHARTENLKVNAFKVMLPDRPQIGQSLFTIKIEYISHVTLNPGFNTVGPLISPGKGFVIPK